MTDQERMERMLELDHIKRQLDHREADARAVLAETLQLAAAKFDDIKNEHYAAKCRAALAVSERILRQPMPFGLVNTK